METIFHHDESEGSTQSNTEAEVFGVAECWMSNNKLVRKSATELNLLNHEEEELETMGTCLGDLYQMLVILPNSNGKHIWEVCGQMLLVYDTVVLPLELLQTLNGLFIRVLAWIVRIFWLINIGVSFFQSYIDSRGSVVRSPRLLVLRYVRTWLFLDVVASSLDWAEVIVGQMNQASRALRTLRIVKVLRLIRLGKAQALQVFIVKHVRSEFVLILNTVMTHMVVMIGLTHLIACAWFGVGRLGQDADSSWTKNLGLESESLLDKYVLSVHCSLALLSAEHVVLPRSTGERIFIAVVLLFAFMFCVWFVSSITTAMTRLSIIAGKRSMQLSALSWYLLDHGISQRLAVMVERNALHALAEQKRKAPEDSIELLRLVSEPLRCELNFEVFSPVLLMHPFFRCYVENAPTGIRRICHDAVCKVSFMRGDMVFSKNEIPMVPSMFFLASGQMTYTQYDSKAQIIWSNQWIAEAVLWTRWMHRGTLRAKKECELLVLDAERFQGVGRNYPGNNLRLYACEFTRELSRMSHANDLGDGICGDPLTTATRVTQVAWPDEQFNRRSTHSLTLGASTGPLVNGKRGAPGARRSVVAMAGAIKNTATRMTGGGSVVDVSEDRPEAKGVRFNSRQQSHHFEVQERADSP